MARRYGRERESRGTGSPARRAAGTGLMLAAILFLLPLFTVPEQSVGEEEELPMGTLPIDREVRTAAGERDKSRMVKLLQEDGTIQELTMAEYLFGVVAAEMPAAFEEEALKAQACAARTYTADKQAGMVQSHPEADVCTDINCCQAYVPRETAETRWGVSAQTYGEKIEAAIAETDGLGVLYQGEPIQAVFFSSAPGYTVDAVEVWGSSVDYLKSVASPEGEEVPNYHSQAVFTADQVREAVLAAYPGADLSGDPSGWFGAPTTNEGGTVSSMLVGGITLTGGQVRNLFDLRSACFTVGWDGSSFTFSVTGYGHGVGMSQYGANAMAQAGSSFEEILTWYYTGTQVEPLW